MAVTRIGVAQSGVRMVIFPEDDSCHINVYRSPESTSTGNPSTSTTSHLPVAYLPPGLFHTTDVLPVNGNLYFYRARAEKSGYNPSTWSGWKSATSEFFDNPQEETVFVNERARRLGTIYDSDEVLQTSVSQTDGTYARRMARGYQSGQTRDGSTVTFPQGYLNIPTVFLTGGLTHQPQSTAWKTSSGGVSTTYTSTKPQYDMFQALNLTSTKFVARAKLRQKAAQSTRGDMFSTGATVTSTGDTHTVNLANAPAAADAYTAHYTVKLDVAGGGGRTTATLVLAIDSNPSTVWTERETATYQVIAFPESTASQTWSHEQKLVAVSGLSTGDDMRLRGKTLTVTGGGTATFTARGFNSTGDANSGITYNTAADIFASKTPDSDDYVTWEAWEVD